MAKIRRRKSATSDRGKAGAPTDPLTIALSTMSHGLCVYRKQRVVLYNPKFLEMFGMSADIVRPGVTMRTVFLYAAGILGSSRSDALHGWARQKEQLSGGKPFTRKFVLPDGRAFAANYRPADDGSLVVVYEDVSHQQRMQQELRLQVERMHHALDNMAHGLAMFDAKERLIVCNQHYLRMFRLDPDSIAPGMSYRELLACSIASNRPGMSLDELYAKRMAIIRNDGTMHTTVGDRAIQTSLRRLANGGWVTACQDITDQIRAEERLIAQNMRFDAALEHMAQGLVMLDRDFRLMVCNSEFLSIYQLPASALKPGMSLLEITQLSVRLGNHGAASPDAVYTYFRRHLVEGQVAVLSYRHPDGRTFTIRSQPMAHGGWVVTYDDVSDRERAAITLREQNLRFDAALNNMQHGLCMVGPDFNIIVCNARFFEIFGMTPDVVGPGTSVRELIRYSMDAGNAPGADLDVVYERYLRRVDQGAFTRHHTLPNGRIISVSHKPMPQGGWIACYEDITERRRGDERIAHMASHDALTGLPNRTLFYEKMALGLARVESGSESMAVLCLDLDDFKTINDTLGHPIGDRLLVTVAQRLAEVLGPDDTIARLGGDEFAILQVGMQPHGAHALALRIVEALDTPIVIDEHEINTGVSVGIAIAPVDGQSAEHLMKCADLALYRAKEDGRSRARFFEPDMDKRLREKRAIEIDLRRALAAGEFELAYQPQVRASDGTLTGMEALLRWKHAERGWIPPADFIPIAEATGLIGPIGEWVLARACSDAALWPQPVRVAVNLSPVQFKGRGLVSTVMSALAASGLPAHRLDLEITEAVLLQDDEATLAILHQLRSLGARISMDDFGTGYSSLSYLRSFPFDKIKIDRSFITGIERNQESLAITRAIAGLGEALGIETTAEGVETAEQWKLVKLAGFTEVQGFYFSPPRPAAEVLALFDSRCGRRVA